MSRPEQAGQSPDVVAAVRAAIEADDNRRTELSTLDELAAITREAEGIADEWAAALEVLLVGQQDGRDAAAQRTVVERFAAIPRIDYVAVWRKEGQRFNHHLWRAAMLQRSAEATDDLFRHALKLGAIVDGSTREHRHLGLVALVIASEREWRRVREAMIDNTTSEVRRAA